MINEWRMKILSWLRLEGMFKRAENLKTQI